MENNKVWFVTGASKGLGLALVKKLLNEGYKVAATSRNLSDLTKAVDTQNEQFLPLAVNLTSEDSVQEAVELTVKTFGKIDVIVNNAGYGLLGGIEELTDREARDNFEVNVFGSLNVIRKVLPYLRAQKSGHILNVSSIGGFTGAFAGAGIYCATKFAVNGFSETLSAEVAPFGIKVTIVQPGYFRTNFLSAGSLAVPQNQIADYQNVRDTVNFHQNDMDKQQAGDPEKAAEAMISITNEANPPLNLFLGEDAYGLVEKKLAFVQNELATWKDLTLSTAIQQ
ncbi:SDR family NAD(P)-dependent oxidoreductase [Mucilaginibacter rubeus]|uniref:SDR family NAD(P)-dependent oxidoreductase n=1 Tax=Mucilaginibacter rubeus TaxID=2027860 RepID=A0AAE6MJV5_9SPHI|nr:MULTISPECIES: oxidoreductase [Mucilaginibacter]QEM06095.1 SDR family NAD(P)-dependent oxidoreductase [Mucilaginibacter rubeus]QEM18675.1 SDR family NAD(P)-dependent oxidoreductase [Mucilaginibacter gossypii]QTE44782.1 SDR family NAD(P)-dependent oxidoreductase [Mucilaginibacter rubeus]QTE51380.1 SDR family NAD(P)-dependent oxidoreductase [Mucilaginibacter rubeus]QTE56467.1 SDR family NAD(P)-dependent oxidoreductase [Mucilaginibacter rubeus]